MRKMLLSLGLAAGLAMGGTWVSGGGFGVLKPSGELEVLDLYRIRKQGVAFAPLPVAPQDGNVETHSELSLLAALDRLRAKSPPLVARILEAREKLGPWTASEDLAPLADFGTPELEPGESPVQIIERRQHRILVRKDLYDKLDARNRAALKLHELVYVISNHRESVDTQALVGLAFSTRLDEISTADFDALLAKVLNLEFQGVSRDPRQQQWPTGLRVTDTGELRKSTCGFVTKLDPVKRSLTLITSGDDPLNGDDAPYSKPWLLARRISGGRLATKTISLAQKPWDALMAAKAKAEAFLKANHSDVFYPASLFDAPRACIKAFGKLTHFEVRLLVDAFDNRQAIKEVDRSIERVIELKRQAILEEQISRIARERAVTRTQPDHRDLRALIEKAELTAELVKDRAESLAMEDETLAPIKPPLEESRQLGSILFSLP